jgi:hypothetical protein
MLPITLAYQAGSLDFTLPRAWHGRAEEKSRQVNISTFGNLVRYLQTGQSIICCIISIVCAINLANSNGWAINFCQGRLSTNSQASMHLIEVWFFYWRFLRILITIKDVLSQQTLGQNKHFFHLTFVNPVSRSRRD